MTGYNLPPGVNVSDLPGNSYDDELAEMIAEGWRPTCKCGAFLTVAPTSVTDWEETRHCTGQPTRVEHSYNDGTHEGILAIIGESYRHETYIEEYPACDEHSGVHEPHEEIMAAGIVEHRLCKRCGRDNELVTM